MKNIGIKLAAVTALALAPSAAFAGKGGSAELIQAAVQSTSVDAIIAEVERAEGLICDECIQTLTNLTEDPRFEVREVAAWWFAKRPLYRDMLVAQFSADLPAGDTIKVRNAADFLGRTRTLTALPQLRAAIHRTGLGAEAKLALVRAVGFMAHRGGNEVLTTAMADGDAQVRAAAVVAWRDMLGQPNAQPVVALLGDSDERPRAGRGGGRRHGGAGRARCARGPGGRRSRSVRAAECRMGARPARQRSVAPGAAPGGRRQERRGARGGPRFAGGAALSPSRRDVIGATRAGLSVRRAP